LKRRRISIIGCAGALMDLTVPKNAGYSGCAAYRKPRPAKKEWHPKPTRANAKTSADAHMVFVLPVEFHARGREELPVAQLNLGPRPVIFEKPRAKNYKHLKALYLKGYINGVRLVLSTGLTE
jgi:hypothetical protein